MMGRLSHDQEQFFYSFCLDEAVADDHPVRQIAAVLDLSRVHSELAPYYPPLGRPSIDAALDDETIRRSISHCRSQIKEKARSGSRRAEVL